VPNLPRSFSPSSAGTYRQCPRRWRFRYVQKLPDPPGEPALLGTFAHRVLELLCSDPAPERTVGLLLLDLYLSDCLLQLHRFQEVLDITRNAQSFFSELGTMQEVGRTLLNEAVAYAGLEQTTVLTAGVGLPVTSPQRYDLLVACHILFH